MTNSIAIACVMAILAAGCATPDPAATETSGEAMSASCIKTYSPENLATQEYAFDGVVTELREESGGEDSGFGEIDFKVNLWFKGGSENSVTLKAPVPASDGAISLVDFPSIEKGGRYLVSGEAGFAHACGFTRTYNDADAQVWEDAF